MNKRDAQLIVTFVARVAKAVFDRNSIDPAIVSFMHAVEGTPGNGACICRASPEERQKHAERMLRTLETLGMNILLGHRCAHHGEKAQPAVWGRHKEKELVVTPAQWLSLGVTYK